MNVTTLQQLVRSIFGIWLHDAYVEKRAENKSQGVAGSLFVCKAIQETETLQFTDFMLENNMNLYCCSL